MRFIPFAAAALIAAAPVAFVSTTPSPLRAQDAANPNTDVVSNEKFVADLEYLASDDLKGRSAADQTIRVAAGYLVDRMSEIGLEMNAIDGDALQEVAFRAVENASQGIGQGT